MRTLTTSEELLDAIRHLPPTRVVEHCGQVYSTSVFDLYFTCPTCGTTIKLRSFGGDAEIEDVFDAVFSWIKQNGGIGQVTRRLSELDDE